MASPNAFGAIMLGVIAVVILVGGMVWLAKKGYFEPDTNEGSLEERDELAEQVGEQDFRIPLRRRVKAWSLPMKVFVGSLALFVLAAAFATYRVMKTGSPADRYLTWEVQLGIVAAVAIAGGVHLERRFDEQIATVDVEYERTGQPNTTERFHYARNRARTVDGDTVVPVIADTRLLGLFHRYRQVGEERRLRGADKPLDDIFTIKVPPHATEKPGGGYHVTTKASESDDRAGDVVLKGATASADLTFSSPNSLSDERAVEIREKINRKDAQLQAIKATNAQLQQELRKLRKAIENDEYEAEEDVLDKLERFSDMMNSGTIRLEKSTENGTGGKSADAEEASAS